MPAWSAQARPLQAAPTHSVVALAWLPEQRTPIPRRLVRLGVVEGAEVDESFRL